MPLTELSASIPNVSAPDSGGLASGGRDAGPENNFACSATNRGYPANLAAGIGNVRAGLGNMWIGSMLKLWINRSTAQKPLQMLPRPPKARSGHDQRFRSR